MKRLVKMWLEYNSKYCMGDTVLLQLNSGLYVVPDNICLA